MPAHEAHDPDAVFEVDSRVCQSCRALKVEQRKAQVNAEAAAKNSDPKKPLAVDGRLWVAHRRRDVEAQLRASGQLPSQQKT